MELGAWTSVGEGFDLTGAELSDLGGAWCVDLRGTQQWDLGGIITWTLADGIVWNLINKHGRWVIFTDRNWLALKGQIQFPILKRRLTNWADDDVYNDGKTQMDQHERREWLSNLFGKWKALEEIDSDGIPAGRVGKDEFDERYLNDKEKYSITKRSWQSRDGFPDGELSSPLVACLPTNLTARTIQNDNKICNKCGQMDR